MADNKAKGAEPIEALIALTEKYEVAYWSKKFKVTPGQAEICRQEGRPLHQKGRGLHRASEAPRTPTRAGSRSAKPMRSATGRRNSRSPPAKLKAAVAAAGHSSKKVEAYLAAQKAAKKKKAKKTTRKVAKRKKAA